MLDSIKKLFRGEHFPLNRIFVSQDKLIANCKLLSSLSSEIQIAPVLKSNAYGHGINQIGRILAAQGEALRIPFVCVDSLHEAYQLQKAGVKLDILIMGYVDPRNLKRKRLPFSYTVFDLDFAKALNEFQKGCEVHVFVGTGMSREGVPLEELPDFLEQLKRLENLKVVGIMSHLASSDNTKSEHNLVQVKNFAKAKGIAREKFPDMKWFHLGGSYALLHGFCAEANVVRCGKAIYGLADDARLQPVLSLRTQIVQVKKINKGAKVGYSETFVAPKDMTIGILPIGYNDGVDRRLSNKGVVRVGGFEGIKSSGKGVFCRIVGLISMNITTIDLSDVKDPYVGQEVEVFSDQKTDKNSIQNCAKLCNTIAYDLLVHINAATRREVG